MLKAILVDDEPSSLNALKEKIKFHCGDVEIIAECKNASQGIEKINSLKPDIVFLDIEMPVMNGFLMLQKLDYKDFELIFTTAYDHYAIKAIRFSALDYLVKPVEIEELKAAVNKATEKRNKIKANQQLELLIENLSAEKKTFKRIAVPAQEGIQFIKIDEIIYLEASVNYTKFYLTHKRKFTVSKTLKEFEDMLPADTFIRIHNSYIINKDYVEKYVRGEGGQVIMSSGAELDVAKRKKADFLKSIGY